MRLSCLVHGGGGAGGRWLVTASDEFAVITDSQMQRPCRQAIRTVTQEFRTVVTMKEQVGNYLNRGDN